MASLDNMPPHEIRCDVCSALVLNADHGLLHLREKHPAYYMEHVLPVLKRRRELQRQNLRVNMEIQIGKVLRERLLQTAIERLNRESVKNEGASNV